MTREDVTTFMISVLQELFPKMPIVRAKQDYGVEYSKYITVDLLSETSLGNQEVWDEENEAIYVAGLVQSVFNVQAYGNGSVELLSTLQANFERPTMVDKFHTANIAVNDVDGVQDLSMLLDGRTWQERASVDLTISYDRSVVDNPGWFDTVEVIGLLTNKGTEKPAKGKMKVLVKEIKTDKEM